MPAQDRPIGRAEEDTLSGRDPAATGADGGRGAVPQKGESLPDKGEPYAGRGLTISFEKGERLGGQ